MTTSIHQEKKFDQIKYSNSTLNRQEFELCVFNNCDFFETTFYGVVFIDCQFNDCNFSMAKLNDTALRGAKFFRCKMMGVVFDKCHPLLFTVQFNDCILDYSSFSKLKMKLTNFKGCSIIEAQFVESDLTGSSFVECNLYRTAFQQSVLEKVDFTTSRNYSIDPSQNRMKKAKFAVAGLPGLLEKYGIIVE
jgi:fluoroquinolone resistance protein